jgi:predicted nucleic acid-binding protein
LILVSDASPIISLSAIARLGLIEQMYGPVFIPEAVYQEILNGSPGQPGIEELRSATWLMARPVRNELLSRALEGELDPGEAAAIALAVEMGEDLLLIDERRGRQAAMRLGLNVLGTLGLLLEAKKRGLIPAIAPVLGDLLQKAGFRVSQQLYLSVLAEAGEQTETE